MIANPWSRRSCGSRRWRRCGREGETSARRCHRSEPLNQQALASQAGIQLSPLLLGLQPLAVKAGYSAEDTPLPDERRLILKEIEAHIAALEARLSS